MGGSRTRSPKEDAKASASLRGTDQIGASNCGKSGREKWNGRNELARAAIARQNPIHDAANRTVQRHHDMASDPGWPQRATTA